MGEQEEPPHTTRMIAQVRSARSIICRVVLLDGSLFETDVDRRAVGQILFDKCCDHLDILEKDYFGLHYVDQNTGLTMWLNNIKKISKQVKNGPWEFDFSVKFYPPDPQQLHEDITRYQLCLQIRNDIVNEKLPCSFVTYTLLGSYTVQSELGDYDREEFGPGSDYIKKMKFAPHQDRELLRKIVDLHKTHRGQTPEEAELHFLENAKKLALYGVELHDAQDAEGVKIQLGVGATGLLVFKDKLQINRFVWPKVLKMSYRRKKFYIKLRPGEFEDFQSLVGFRTPSVKHAKILWKICVEHHSFFRFREIELPKQKGTFPRFGSRFRYSGRTQFQTRQAMAQVDRPSPYFDRIHSQRATYGGRPTRRQQEYRPPQDHHIQPRRPPPKKEEYIERDEDHKPPIESEEEEERRSEHEREKEVRGSNRSLDEDHRPPDRRSRMEKIHAVPTPLAVVMKKAQENNVENLHPHSDAETESLPDKPPLNDSMDQSFDEQLDGIPAAAPEERIEIPPFKVYTKEEQKRMAKEEKEKIKKAKLEEKRRKKEEEKERKRQEKEKKQSLKHKKGKDKGKQWAEAVAVASTGEEVIQRQDSMDRSRNRLSSFEDPKEEPDESEDKGLPPPPSPPEDREDRRGDDEDSNKAEGEGSADEEEEQEASRVGQEFDL